MNKDNFLNKLKDTMTDFVYYDRKEDEDLNVKDVEEIIESGQVTPDEMGNTVKQFIEENFNVKTNE